MKSRQITQDVSHQRSSCFICPLVDLFIRKATAQTGDVNVVQVRTIFDPKIQHHMLIRCLFFRKTLIAVYKL